MFSAEDNRYNNVTSNNMKKKKLEISSSLNSS